MSFGHLKREAGLGRQFFGKGLGLRQLYLGLESGSDEVRRTLSKGGTAQDAVQTVARLHGAGLAVGIIVLLGAGGA